MNAIVVHCDVLSRESYGIFFLQNIENYYMKFSSINVMPYTNAIEKEFNVKFVEEKYEEYIENGIELCEIKNHKGERNDS